MLGHRELVEQPTGLVRRLKGHHDVVVGRHHLLVEVKSRLPRCIAYVTMPKSIKNAAPSTPTS